MDRPLMSRSATADGGTRPRGDAMRWLLLLRAAGDGVRGPLVELASDLRDAGDECHVAAEPGGPAATECRARGLAFHERGPAGRGGPPAETLARLIRTVRPDVVCAEGLDLARAARRADESATILAAPRDDELLTESESDRRSLLAAADRILSPDAARENDWRRRAWWLLPGKIVPALAWRRSPAPSGAVVARDASAVAALRAAMMAVMRACRGVGRPALEPLDGWRGVCRPGFPADLLAESDGPAVKRTRRIVVRKRSTPDGDIYLKWYKVPDAGARLRYGWRPPRAIETYRAAHRLALAGLAVAEPLAAAARRRWGLTGDSVFAAAGVPGSILTEWWRRLPGPSARRRAVERAARWMAALHENGIRPHDLKDTNILARTADADPAEAEFVLIDLDNLRFVRQVGERATARNFKQFLCSFKALSTPREQLRFALVYARLRRLSRPALRRVIRTALRMLLRP